MKIGTLDVNGNVFLAPMAGIADTAFRKVVQQGQGSGLLLAHPIGHSTY